MQLLNSFLVPASIDKTWDILTDVERIAPCMPGATLDGVDGDNFSGSVKVKLGPITMSYGGQARFVERHPEEYWALFEGSAKETKGAGTAAVQAKASLESVTADSTRVNVVTDVTITGKAAQFGRGVMQDVAGRIVDQFAANLGELITTSSAPEAAAAGAETAAAGPSTTTAAPSRPRQDEAIDLMGTAGMPVLKRLAPIIIGAVVLGGIVWWVATR